jgi:RNA-directed DNA polymerase
VAGLARSEVANGGSADVDGVSLEEVERQGVAPFLEVIAADLKAGRYQPQPVLRVYIPKPDGRLFQVEVQNATGYI